ncbi:MAG: insulinase family protein [Armatimonadetes bacterium]|nr:insulinase family protein [Armatimonadota bacterium]
MRDAKLSEKSSSATGCVHNNHVLLPKEDALSDSRLHTHTYDNGLTLVAEAIPNARAVAFQFQIPAGAVTDPQDGQGACSLLEILAYRGAGSYTARELSDALDSLGLQRHGAADLEYTTFGGSLLREDLSEALSLFADILLRPHLPDEQADTAKTIAMQRIAALEDNPSQKLFVYLQEAFFTSPHGRSTLGTPEGIGSLTIERLREDHAQRYRPMNSILGVAGSFDWEELVRTVERLFGEWAGEAPPLPQPETEGRKRYLHLPKEDASQMQIGVAYPEIAPDHLDFYNSLMAVQVLSAGMGSRLFTEVREKRGLVYSVFASNRAVKDSGLVLAYAGTTPDRSQDTLDVLLAELKRLPEGVTQEEVDRARTGLLSTLVMQGESTGGRVGALTRDLFLRGRVRTLDEIRGEVERVTPESIQRHLEAHPPKEFTVVTLGPAELEVRE